jgi:hypothetical protein
VRKQGYIVEPHRTLVVVGFRRSLGEVAVFRFSPVRESYAQEKYRSTRNVGVIGIALCNERGTSPWSGQEVTNRLKANPFPRDFATPP